MRSEQRSSIWRNVSLVLFVNWYGVDIFGILARNSEELFVQVPSWWTDNEESHVLFVPTQTVLAHYSTFALRKDRLSLLRRIAVTEHCVYAPLSFFSFAPNGGTVDHTPDLQGSTTIAEPGIMIPSLRSVHIFVTAVALCSILQGLKLEYKGAYFAYHMIREVDWDDKDCVGWPHILA